MSKTTKAKDGRRRTKTAALATPGKKGPAPGLQEKAMGQPDGNPERLTCPRCECAHLPVYRTIQRGGRVYRQRMCRNCGRRVLTREDVV